MMPSWARLLFAGQPTLFYRVTMLDRVCVEQWTTYHGEEQGELHRLTFLAEVDPAAMGSGGAKLRLRGELWCTPALEPVRYSLQGDNVRLQLRFSANQVDVLLPDGSTQSLDRAGATFLSDGNFPATLALIYAAMSGGAAPPPVEHLKLKLFVANTLVTVPYETSPAEDLVASSGRWHRTSHRTEVLLDESGVMLEARSPDSGFSATLIRQGPPVPDWPDPLVPGAPPLAYRPPQSARFRLEDVEIAGPVTPLGATLSIPPGKGPFPAVLFISGSGTHDRHGIAGEIDLGSHEVMDDLAAHGFVGLRFDTRGAGTTGLGADFLDRGLGADITDARACLAYLSARPEAAGQPLFLIGHSQGATIAMVLAGESSSEPGVRGVVLMAAMGRDLDEVLADQILAHGQRLGLSEAQIEAQQADTRKVAELIRSGSPWDAEQLPHHLLATFRTRTWYEEFLRHPTSELIGKVRCPMLLCQGGEDFQVSPERDAERLLAAACRSGRDCTYALFPGLDHLFKRTRGQSSLAEYFEPRPVAPEFLARLRTWLASRAGLKT
ncbi:hypothetical protein CYFUS_003088 [Cystobacter fuscus]|uniref:Serine aminopeptidase S33 domain-containing protein n=1 Tax=Cystobacter fuscus TaxID=43 RepID=A0A250J268_9BACT|nr:alpha/beta fold hydrolase [Cystobacter fuscus]ATB37663.1 hypothetical protein CYFUS_003088 [Cystobacter fuscus]